MRNVVVTGASRGIGLAIAGRLAAQGYRVAAVSRTQTAELAEAADLAKRAGQGAIHFQAFDLTRIEAMADLVKFLRRDIGPIYGLVNNAGLGTAGILATMRDEDIEALVRINTIAPIVLAKHVVRAMMAAQGGGRIVNIASIVAQNGYRALSVYSATKASLLGFTRSLAREVGSLGITVNAVAPGFVDTDMTRELGEEDRERLVRRSAMRRLADAQDVAAAVAYLLGEDGRNVTGTVLTVDAGSTA